MVAVFTWWFAAATASRYVHPLRCGLSRAVFVDWTTTAMHIQTNTSESSLSYPANVLTLLLLVGNWWQIVAPTKEKVDGQGCSQHPTIRGRKVEKGQIWSNYNYPFAPQELLSFTQNSLECLEQLGFSAPAAAWRAPSNRIAARIPWDLGTLRRVMEHRGPVAIPSKSMEGG